MRKNKGYQKDTYKHWHGTEQKNSYAGGTNKSLEQLLREVDEKFDSRVEQAKLSYEYVAKNASTLQGEDLRKFCHEHCLWEVAFEYKNKLEPISLEQALEKIEYWRQKEKGRITYSYQKRTVNKDNQKFVYNMGSGCSQHSVRIPSLKRSNAVWKRFYELFPYYREHYEDLITVNGLKLKKVW